MSAAALPDPIRSVSATTTPFFAEKTTRIAQDQTRNLPIELRRSVAEETENGFATALRTLIECRDPTRRTNGDRDRRRVRTRPRRRSPGRESGSRSMRERTEMVGGNLDLISTPVTARRSRHECRWNAEEPSARLPLMCLRVR